MRYDENHKEALRKSKRAGSIKRILGLIDKRGLDINDIILAYEERLKSDDEKRLQKTQDEMTANRSKFDKFYRRSSYGT